ncbi:SRPBCC domain-containing protein [Paucisalibacillus sp. EB02]|uniref:SRPBCC domain-containing protein n=1 Tax=Paucisalibacillus sp. EB02 TaxID=1347087 RepID=UPI0004AFA356|nr:SRPBCC domain-containing protein [Paucisalibacillus sp. EB02]
MTEKLIVKDEVLIEASPSTVWEVLTNPKYVAQWDELPENYPSDPMGKGSKVVWEHPNGGQTVTTIIKAEEMKELKIALYSSNWEEKVTEGDIAYLYQLEDSNGNTLLKIQIGDFSVLNSGQDYYDASVEFASESKKVIKELAEKL